MANVASASDTAAMELFSGSMQIKFLDRRPRAISAELANSTFGRIAAHFNPRRRYSAVGYRSPIELARIQYDGVNPA